MVNILKKGKREKFNAVEQNEADQGAESIMFAVIEIRSKKRREALTNIKRNLYANPIDICGWRRRACRGWKKK